jgi:5'-nucleotidase
VIFLAACTTESRVVIVSTNDIHSSIDNFPRLATLVEDLRAAEGADRVLLADAGDRWTGNPFVDIAPQPLMPVVELQNELGYDVSTLGNHEFDWGQPRLRSRLDRMNFPVVGANTESAGSELGPVPPYVFIEAGGMRFAFLGLVYNTTQWRRPEGKAEHFIGLTFPDVVETAARYAALADSADVFVGLTHIGHDADVALAGAVPALDLIIGGHTHTVVEDAPLVNSTTLVTQAGSRLRYAGVTTVTRQKGLFNGRRGQIDIENRLVMLDTIAPSPRFEEMVRRYNSNPALLEPVGATAAPLDSWGVRNLVTDAIRADLGADIVLYHSGGIRVDTLAGGIATADLHRIEPFLSEVYTLRMTPGQIKGLIMNRFAESPGRDVMPSGLAYTIVTDESGRAVDVVFDRPERTSYLVAMPDYLYKNYIFDRSEEAAETGRQVTDILRRHITAHNPLQPDNGARIAIQ